MAPTVETRRSRRVAGLGPKPTTVDELMVALEPVFKKHAVSASRVAYVKELIMEEALGAESLAEILDHFLDLEEALEAKDFSFLIALSAVPKILMTNLREKVNMTRK